MKKQSKVEPVEIDRAQFLQKLEDARPGLSAREIVDQSSCFVFKAGQVITFNEEVCCRLTSGLPEAWTGAVQARPLIELLRKLPEDVVHLRPGDRELVVTGRRREAGILLEPEVLLPVDGVEPPGKWRKLDPDFGNAIAMVQECAGKDESLGWTTCVHFHPDWVEACDNHQLTRYTFQTGLTDPVLVKRTSLTSLPSIDLTHLSQTPNWLHFKGQSGTVVSCRRHMDEFRNLTKLTKVDGGKITLPSALGEAAEKAEIFSAENPDNNRVLVQVRAGRLRITGKGASGWYREVKKVKYSGPPIAFSVAPKLLTEIVKRHTDCLISSPEGSASRYLRVDGGKWVYVACLQPPELTKPAGDASDNEK